MKVLVTLAALCLLGSSAQRCSPPAHRTCTTHDITMAVNFAANQLNLGLEVEPFKVGEYNTQLSAWFPAAQAQGMSLNYPNPTIGYASAYSSNAVTLSSDEIDTLMINEYIPTIKKKLCRCNHGLIRYLSPNCLRYAPPSFTQVLPYIHVQTSGHVSGIAYYYQESDVQTPPPYWSGSTIFGASYHPTWQGDVTFAGTLVFEDHQDNGFMATPPVDSLLMDVDKITFLNLVNGIVPPP